MLRANFATIALAAVYLAPACAEQFVLFDVTFSYTKADADNSTPSKSHYYVREPDLNRNRPADWTSPVDYRNGSVHIRLEVLEKPTGGEETTWTLCYIPNKGQGNGYGCTGTPLYKEKGVYERDVPMASFWENEAIVWSEGIKQMDLVIKDNSGGRGHAHRRADHEKFFPTKVRITMVQVSKGSTYDPRKLTSTYFPPPDSAGGWRTLAGPEAIRKTAGVDLTKLDAAFDYVQQTAQHGGLLVLRHGYLVYERYYGRGHREALPELASCGKAFTSLAVGMMLREKAALIPDGLDQKVFTPDFLPGLTLPLDDPRKAAITLGQLLSMSAGIRGTNPVYVGGVRQTWENPTEDNGPYSTTDAFALRQSLWCAPGECYSYATSSSHLPAMIVRKLTGMEMEDYLRLRLTGPLGFGTWGYAMYRPKLKGGIDENGRMYHTPGGGSIAIRSTDMLRFGYLMLHEGKWGDQQIVPAEFARLCGRKVKYNPHYTHSFNFNVNEDGNLKDVPRDAYWKGGAGGYAIYVVPSLDLVVWKLGGNEGQYDPALTRLPVKSSYDGSRAQWKPADPKSIGDVTGRTLQMVVGSLLD